MPMKVLVACEFSGVVRRAFAAQGCLAWSCDLLDAEDGDCRHHKGDVMDVLHTDLLEDGWDLLIAHPPCTHLSVSGARWFKDKADEQRDALEFVRFLLDSPIPRIALENPVGVISSRIRRPDQIIQPWQFGHPESKKTCLWLKSLPLLRPTNVLPKPSCGYWSNQTPSGQNKIGPSASRWAMRSRTYEGIANAMAAQWTAALKAGA